MASSNQCPVYIYKFNMLKLKYSKECSKEEAKIILGDRSVTDPPPGDDASSSPRQYEVKASSSIIRDTPS